MNGSLISSPKPSLQVSLKTPVEGLLLGTLLALASLNKVESELLSLIGTGAITLCLILSIFLAGSYVLRRGGIPKALLVLLLFSSLSVLTYGFGLLRRLDAEGMRNLGLIFFEVVYLFTISTIKWQPRDFKFMLMPFGLLTGMIFLSFIPILSTGQTETYLGNLNFLGATSLFGSVFVLLYLVKPIQETAPETDPTAKGFAWTLVHVPYYVILFLNLVIIFLSRSRGVWLALLVSLATFLLWKYITKYKLVFSLYFLVFVALGVGIVCLTVFFPLVSLASLNDISGDFASKGLESGRERIWPTLLNLISDRPWLGYGAGAMPSNLTTIELSAHNYYLQVLLQVGGIGLGFIVLMLKEIWSLLRLSRHNPRTRVIGSLFAGILFHQNFEVSLTQNNMALGILFFTIFGIGISESLRIDRNSMATNQ